MTTSTYFEDDRARGLVSAPIRLAVIEDVAGWVICTELATGKTMAYPPMHYALEIGLIAQEIPVG